jgi:hypothetical protein
MFVRDLVLFRLAAEFLGRDFLELLPGVHGRRVRCPAQTPPLPRTPSRSKSGMFYFAEKRKFLLCVDSWTRPFRKVAIWANWAAPLE